ncbi:MAG: hypothetical protein KGQ52_09130 [Alphaproteobacteria bacterium]|nr:hypothetical protein [Alphaproteobacteria bacterium]
MMLLIALAAQMMATTPPPARNRVAATGFACDFTLPGGAGFTVAGVVPAFLPGRDPNAQQGMALAVAGMAELAGRGSASVASDSGGEFRDYQISLSRGEAMYVANLKLRAGSGGIAWMTRYAPTTPPEAYRYFAAGHCRSDFEGKPVQ